MLRELPDDPRDTAIQKLIEREKTKLENSRDRIPRGKASPYGQSISIRLRTSVIKELRKTLEDERKEIQKNKLGALIGSGEEAYYPRKNKTRGTALENSNFNL